jgi:glycosyltransferase involved in cell wall biosynthesis
MPTNVTARLAGYSNQADLLATYGRTPVDLFVNVSASEGTPVSLMEAAACGIPILATAVGGNTEVVSARNGVLLRPDANGNDVGLALLSILDRSSDAIQWRDGSREVWQNRYNAARNFSDFAERLRALVA